MGTHSVWRVVLWSALAALVAVAAAPAAALAQDGRVAGVVMTAGGEPLDRAAVVVVGTSRMAVTGRDGAFTITAVPPGVHSVRVSRIGYREATVANVSVGAGETASVEIRLEVIPFEIAGLVVSASRQAERVTDAPATVTRIDAADIELAAGNSFSGALRQVKGLDYIQVGATTAAVNARGFNSSFNNRMLMLEDGRVSVLPESGLPVGIFTAIPRIDLAGVEVLVGPGAALYGADASNGVLSLQTKDPRDYPGTSFELTGGTRSFRNVQARHAGVSGNIGFKITGEWLEVDEFENRLQYEFLLPEPFDEEDIDWRHRTARVSGSVARYGDDSKLEFRAGYSHNDGVGQTNVGRNQFDGWTYNFLQATYSTPSWFFNAYRNQSQSGTSYEMRRYSFHRLGGESHEDAADLAGWPSDGQLYAAEIQNNFELDGLFGTRFVWGAQLRYDRVSSKERWLSDRQTGDPVDMLQLGAYLHTETPLGGGVRLLLAGRVDDHEDYETQFSPKAGVLYSPAADHTLRLTYNQAFKSPTILQNHFWIPDFVPGIVGVFGNREGFTVRDDQNNLIREIEPLVPEKNQTVELGYKGVLAERFYVDVTGYWAEYKNFLGSLLTWANPFIGEFAFHADGSPVVDEQNNRPLLFTYRNLGRARLKGTDMGVRFLLTESLDLAGTFSWLDLSSLDIDPEFENDPDATALNSPPVKLSLSLNGRHLPGGLRASIDARHVTGYHFASGMNVGKIPTFSTAGVGLAYELPGVGTTASVRLNNFFTCRSEYDNPERDRRCGFGVKHSEMINMPRIGPVLFVGMRVDR